MAARAYYAQATDDGYELGDLTVAAIAHGHTARLALTEGQPAAALRHLDAAARLDVTDPAAVAWLANVEAMTRGSFSDSTIREPAPAFRWSVDRATRTALGAASTRGPATIGRSRGRPTPAAADRRAS
jgi:hypothetical protein